MNYYLSQYLLIRGLIGNRITTVHASRGCPFDCSFCSSRIVFKKVRYFSCEYVIDELKELISKFKVRAVFFTDDTFILDKKRVWDLCESLIKSGLNKRLKWEVQGRANLLNWNDLGLLRLMKKAGCVQIDYGFEVGDDKVLRFLKKENVSVELNRRAIEITKKAGLRVLGTFMLAVPGENDAQMEKTRRFIKENFKDIDFFQVFIATPYPGSELYRICLEQGTVKEDYIEQIEKEEREDKIQIYSNSVTPKKVIEILSSLDKLMLKKISFFNKAGWLFYNLAHFPKDTVRRLLKFLLKNKT
ncbi:MAG TPA: radical SAM protein [Candidatus Omnitrophota bacterium]|nr:radical SAM protein [Candidatus Omnitrophota bacterium]